MASVHRDEKVEVHYQADHAEATGEQPVMDEEWHRKGRSVVRKLDMTLMPMIWILYLFNYLDRNNIAQAKVSSALQFENARKRN